jgi:murein DD-endopeptidase MepM/ murein hydrolase activator NlpD
LELNDEAYSLFVGETRMPAAGVYDSDSNPVALEIVWQSADPDVAVIVDGRVLARAPGRTHVRAIAGDLLDSLRLTVHETPALQFPLRGRLNRDYWIDWSVPHRGPGAWVDTGCGDKIREGHYGTDFALADMIVMDTGVTVYASAAGTVVSVHDGEYDRHVWGNETAIPNEVVVEHEQGVRTIYSSLRKSSIQVAPGEVLERGQAIGQVGSSGWSAIPHLHFELLLDGRSVDPYAGPCGRATSYWEGEHPYDGSPQLIRAHVSDWPEPGPRHYKLQVPPPADTIVTGRYITPWVQQMNVLPGVEAGIRILDASGTVRVDRLRRYDAGWPTMFYTDAPFLSDTIQVGGDWTMEYWHGGSIVATDTFHLIVRSGAP